jgi:hypothetical protein
MFPVFRLADDVVLWIGADWYAELLPVSSSRWGWRTEAGDWWIVDVADA